jgi:hypothetical protein
LEGSLSKDLFGFFSRCKKAVYNACILLVNMEYFEPHGVSRAVRLYCHDERGEKI